MSKVLRLGAPGPGLSEGIESWVAWHRARGYRAAYCPVGPDADSATVQAVREAAEAADLVIAEVGVWNNPLSADDTARKEAVERCKACLDLADRIGARCCVNIAGSRGERWDGPSFLNLAEETFMRIVDTVREIVDAVQPRAAVYTLETMPWIFPHTVQAYADLLRAIDRPAFGVHLDLVNITTSPETFFRNAELTREAFRVLGPQVRAVHVKDIDLLPELTVHLQEMRPGLGRFDLGTLLTEAARFGDLPMLLEHLPSQEEYELAAAHMREVARSVGVSFEA